MQSKSLCFLIGAPRSGTTWLQRMMQAHPAACGGEESHFFRLFTPALKGADVWQADDRRTLGPLSYIERDTYDAGFHDMWDRIFGPLYAAHPEATLHVEKTPEHALCLPQIVRLFPQARFVLLLRDSRAVTASLLDASQGWGSYWAPSGTREAAATWRRYVRVAMKWHGENPDHPFLISRYEDLVADPEAELARILRFALPEGTDLQLDQTLATHAAEQEAKAKASDVAGFARLRGTEGWRSDLSAWQKLVVWKETRSLMTRLGYDIRPF